MPFFLLFIGVCACNLWIVLSTQSRVFSRPEQVQGQSVAILLGTSKNVSSGNLNQHFRNRVEAAAELFHAGKISQLLVSGHRDSQYYDETRDMRRSLMELGVPDEAIQADIRGARTYDSIYRAKSVYGLHQAVIVSDDFHVNRALFLADQMGFDAVAYRSATVSFENSSKVRFREYFARVKAVIDLWSAKRPPRADKGTRGDSGYDGETQHLPRQPFS